MSGEIDESSRGFNRRLPGRVWDRVRIKARVRAGDRVGVTAIVTVTGIELDRVFKQKIVHKRSVFLSLVDLDLSLSRVRVRVQGVDLEFGFEWGCFTCRSWRSRTATVPTC